MEKQGAINTLFVDIGGVLLTNGWDRVSRELAIKTFHLEPDEIKARHDMYYYLHELGIITLDDYIKNLVFWKERDFSMGAFRTFMYEQSKPFPEMMEMIKDLKRQYNLTVVALSNEGRELGEYRIKSFNLKEFFDVFVMSCFVKMRKPDPGIYRMALELSQANPLRSLYIDDRPILVEAGRSAGLKGIGHHSIESTREVILSLLNCSL